ncbi:thiolase family protein [uncultured Microbacterium sp.]|uniref:thiolase family protein n=1 Tax=uncultured Microbacterium sp. TaxID=191216 RepID=UPI0028DB4E30|nr:thiolase family protein [uncultured Microbacterium sp.]
MPDAVILAARRTPFATRGRRLADVPVEHLAAPVLRAVVADAAIDVPIADVTLGNCRGPGGNPARVATLASGLDPRIPGVTIDRQCASGLAAVVSAVTGIRAGDDRVHLAGGAESASTAPLRSTADRVHDRAPFAPDGFDDPDMTVAADDLAARFGISRGRQDAQAERSHRRAIAARDARRFDAEIVAIGSLRADDAIGAALPVLSRLRPLHPGGTVTAATATRVSDGAAAVLVAPVGAREGRPGLLVRDTTAVGCDPALPGLGAAFAVDDLLQRQGVELGGIGAIEIVEAFAPQMLAICDHLGIVEHGPRLCADGGALALGHPWGASGAAAVVRLFSRLIRGGAPAGTLGVAAVSAGGGIGVAMLVEVVR